MLFAPVFKKKININQYRLVSLETKGQNSMFMVAKLFHPRTVHLYHRVDLWGKG
jgi:hypothetical protein